MKRVVAFVAYLAVFGGCASPGLAKQEVSAMNKSVVQRGEKAFQSVGQSIRQSELIVIGEYLPEGKILVKEVLKGDASWKGKTLELKSPIYMGCRLQPVPGISTVAVCLKKDWQKHTNPVVEIYDTADQISLLQCLTAVFAKGSEHARLVAFSELFVDPTAHCTRAFGNDPHPMFREEFYCEIKNMREPANFEIVKQLYFNPKIDARARLSLLTWIADSGDVRAVPILIDALRSADRFLVSDAVCKLISYYSGEHGVDAALEHALKSGSKDDRPAICRYLSKRGHNVLEVAKSLPKQTPFQHAEELSTDGRSKEAAGIYLSILESGETNGYLVRASALQVLKHGDDEMRSRVLKSRLAWLTHDAGSGNYLEVADTAEILRRLKDERCVDALLTILSRREFMLARANKIATMAIVELGVNARQKAATALIKEMTAGTDSIANKSDEQIRLLLEFAWIAQTDADLAAASQLIANNVHWSSSWKNMQPLLRSEASDEGLFLIHTLQNQQTLPQEAVDWIIFRLGDLRERRAADILISRFQNSASYSPQTISEALESISGDQIKHKIEALASDTSAPSQTNAVDVLCNIEQQSCLPILRKVIKSGGSEAKMHAINAVARFGTASDLKLLVPMSDYWTGDRPNHYWLMQAVAGIRDRCNCNNDGTLVRKG